MKKKKIIISVCACALVLGAGLFAWTRLAAPTKVAFVNYQAITLGQIAKANSGNSWVRISELSPEELGRAADFDMVLVNGMGLRVTEEQRQALIDAAQAGTPVVTTAATNPQNMVVSVDSVDLAFISQYLAGGRSNYRNLAAYI
ncbi:MAG: cobaltochelatase subunit CobN, partial [Muribaculaceae bacterium]|nr:cobaltochelatase subunit CobN [Muribaculaceae bacterium]